MKIIVGNRGTGKTVRMLDWLTAPTNEVRILLVFNAVERQRLRDTLRRGFQEEAADRVIILEELKGLRGSSKVVVGIDELGVFLMELLRLPIGPVSATSEVEVIND